MRDEGRRAFYLGEPFEGPASGFFLGFSVFTTVRLEPHPLWLPEHLDRLRAHAEALGLAYPGHRAFERDLERLQGPLLVRLMVGEGGYLTEARPFRPPPASAYREGVRVWPSRHRTHPLLGRYKTGAYLPYLLAQREAQREGAFEALLQDPYGFLVDGSRTSPLFYREGVFYLPEGGLEGITRRKVLERAQREGFKVVRRRMRRGEGLLLLAGTGVGLLPAGPPPPELWPLVLEFRPRYTGE
ncbi:aminotransferase class IV [Thermus filiformis]|uniref:aminotransferase class IV n=1 Tax=Thermus filiformis TaxID=276 RepID=UPI000B1A5A13